MNLGKIRVNNEGNSKRFVDPTESKIGPVFRETILSLHVKVLQYKVKSVTLLQVDELGVEGKGFYDELHLVSHASTCKLLL